MKPPGLISECGADEGRDVHGTEESGRRRLFGGDRFLYDAGTDQEHLVVRNQSTKRGR